MAESSEIAAPGQADLLHERQGECRLADDEARIEEAGDGCPGAARVGDALRQSADSRLDSNALLPQRIAHRLGDLAGFEPTVVQKQHIDVAAGGQLPASVAAEGHDGDRGGRGVEVAREALDQRVDVVRTLTSSRDAE